MEPEGYNGSEADKNPSRPTSLSEELGMKIYGPYPECTPTCPPYCTGHNPRVVEEPRVGPTVSFGPREETKLPESPKETSDQKRKRALLSSELYPFRHVQQTAIENELFDEQIAVLGGSAFRTSRTLEVAKKRKGKNLRFVCACGHSEGAHHRERDQTSCQIGMVWCNCKLPSWVLLAENVRHFAHKTNGAGPNHALTKGIVSTQIAGWNLESLVEKICWSCRKPTPELIAVSLYMSSTGPKPAPDFDGAANVLWCDECCQANSVAIYFPGSLV